MFLASLLTIIKMSPLVKELWPVQDFTTRVEQDFMKSLSLRKGKKSARRGAQLVPIGHIHTRYQKVEI